MGRDRSILHGPHETGLEDCCFQRRKNHTKPSFLGIMLFTCCVKLSAMLHPFFSGCFPCFCELLVAPLSDLQFAPATSKYYTFFVRAIHINVA